MGIGTRLDQLLESLAPRNRRRKTYDEPDASAAPGLARNRTANSANFDAASDGTPASLRTGQSQDQELNR
jgi:hypothetical protein